MCGSTQYVIPFTKRTCQTNTGSNVLDTGLTDCELRDAEHQYCSALFQDGWSTFEGNEEGHAAEYVVLVSQTEIDNPPSDFVFTTDTNLAIKVGSVSSSRTLSPAAIVTYEIGNTTYTGTLVGQCELDAPLCLSCGSGRSLKNGTGANINTLNKTALNFNSNSKSLLFCKCLFSRINRWSDILVS